jgi:prepilin-type processing-associated H-X9-DG protein
MTATLPSSPQPSRWTPGSLVRARANSQYAYNASGTARFQSPANLGLGGFKEGNEVRPTTESRVLVPADTIAIGDVAPGTTTTLPPGFPVRQIFGGSSWFDVCSTNGALWPGQPHGGAANLVFVDGHVESARRTNWLSPATAGTTTASPIRRPGDGREPRGSSLGIRTGSQRGVARPTGVRRGA